MGKKIILTFDLEFWYNSEFLKKYLPNNQERLKDYVPEAIFPLLELLKKFNIKATFFVLGKVAEKYPEIIKKISSEGHEIASHGYSHRTLNSLDQEEFEKEIRLSVELLEKITGKKPIGFRAPDFTLSNKTKWVLEILGKYGFKYDSSIFPFKTQLYGSLKAPLGIYKISKENVFEVDNNSKITEFPLAVYKKAKIRIPVGGGFYFRFIPFLLYKIFLKSVQKERPIVLYIHPHELYNFIPDIKAPFWKIKLKYWKVNKSLEKLERLLRSFKFTSVENYINENQYDEI